MLFTNVVVVGCGVLIVLFKGTTDKVLLIFIYLLFFLLLIIGLNFQFFYEYNDPEVLFLPIRLLIYVLSGYFLAKYCIHMTLGVNELLGFIVFSTVINSLFVILFFVFPSIAGLVGSYLNYESQLNWVVTGHRAFDISIGGGASASFTFSIVFLISLFLIIRMRSVSVYVACAVIIFLGSMLMGRTGLYFNVSILAVIVILTAVYNKSITSMFVLLIAFIIVTSVYVLLSQGYVYQGESKFLLWALQGVASEEDNGTAKVLLSMWSLPAELSDVLVGTGNLGRNDFLPYISSDIGYVRMIHGLGLIFTIVIYAFPLACCIYFYKMYKSPETILLLVLYTMILGMNLKELHLASRGTSVIFSMLFFYVFLSKKQRSLN